MNAQIELIEGTNRDASKSQYFTPPKLAERVVEWAFTGRTSTSEPLASQARVLEPSAGNGALVRPLVVAGADVFALEIDPRYRDDLLALTLNVACPLDFLHTNPLRGAFSYDLCVMNPPYHDDGESKFILHALEFAPRVVGIFRADVFYTVTRNEGLWSKVRPTRVAFCSRRPWKGAETDYCVLELQRRDSWGPICATTLEWWGDAW